MKLGWKVLMFSDAAQLAADAPNQSGVMSVGPVVRRLGAEEIHIEIDFDWKTRNAQVLKARAKETDRRNITLNGMVGDYLPDDAIGGDHLHYVQALDYGGDQCCPAAAGLGIEVPGHVRIRRAERNNRLQHKMLSTMRVIAPFLRQMRVHLGLDVMLERKPKMAGEDSGFCMIVVGSAVYFGHCRTHAPCVRTFRRMSDRSWLLFFPESGLLDGDGLMPVPEYLE